MESDSSSEKNSKKNPESKTEPSERILSSRNVLSTVGLRRGIRNSIRLYETSLQKSVLAYNKCVLLYIGPIFYIAYIIFKTF